MIRTKAKSLLLSVMLIMASIIFFGCKDEVYIKVESVNFVDQSINLLVGEEYAPEIKILPSYATDRSYTLISSDNVALGVNGGSIKALNPAKGVALKVEYNADKTFNDVILVNIYAQSEQLATPTEFKFDGNMFSFVGVDNAEAYILEINGEEINIGNNTQYLFDNANAKFGDLFDKELVCSVKAVADGKIFTESESCEAISIVKMSAVQNVSIENKILTFGGVANVARYDVKAELNGVECLTEQVEGTEFDLTGLISQTPDNGAEYVIKVAPSKTGYNVANQAELFVADFAEIRYTVIGKVNNVALSGKVVSWDFVQNAQTYTLELYKSGVLEEKYENITTNSVALNCEDAGDYMCKVIANSTAANTATGTKYSDNLLFEILQAPEISVSDNEVKWNSVSGAQSYLVTINRVVGGTKQELTKTFVNTTNLIVDEYESGNYEVGVFACSNNNNVLPSKSSSASWSKLGLQNLRVVDGVLFWDNAVENTVEKYEVVSNNKTVTVNNVTNCDLSQFEFKATTDAKDYEIKVKAIGSGAAFGSDEELLTVTKLPDAVITKLENNVFTVQYAPKSTCQIKIYKDNAEVATLGKNLTLNASSLEAGDYTAKAIVTGNGAEILDADNLGGASSTNSKKFTKLASPKLSITGQSLAIENVEYATGYTLTENGEVITGYTRPYDLATRLTGKSAGNYVYKVKAVGNNKDILDSNENSVSVKKLSAPSVVFNKTTLVCTVNCVENEKSYVGNYTVYINENNSLTTATGSNTIDCSSVIEGVGEYRIQAIANPRVASDTEYDLILASDKSETQSVDKLSGECAVTVDGGNLIVTPKNALNSNSSYTLTLNIKGNGQDISVTTNIDDKFVVEVVDSNYNPYSKFEGLFTSGGEYKLYASIAPYGTTGELASDSVECGTLQVLGTVAEVSKQGQSIKFKKVADADNYKAIITLNNVSTAIEIQDKIQDLGDCCKIDIEDLKILMESSGVSYLEGVDYKIKFIATSTAGNVLANYKTVTEFAFQFLKAPTVEIKTLDGQKILNITADGTVNHNIIIKQNSENVKTIDNTDESSINLDNITGLKGGEVEISVNNVYAGEGNVFDSSYTNITATKLALANASNFTTQDGKLVWDEVENAKHYSLSYFVEAEGKEETINLAYGSANFVIKDGLCIYDFKDLEEGDKSLTLQIFSEEGNFLNSNPQTLTVHKLIAPTISVVDGVICFTIDENIARVANVNGIELGFGDLIVNDLFKLGTDELKLTEDDKTTTEDDKKIQEYQKYLNSITIRKVDKSWTILVDAKNFIEYGTTELLEQAISAKLYSTTAVGKTILNSNISQKTVKGLLAPINVKIEKSLTTNQDGSVTETAEKIVWTNPAANGQNVTGYQVIINYNKGGFENVDYKFDVPASQNYLKMPKYYPMDNDANGDGINNYNEDVNQNNRLDMGEDIDGNGQLNGLEQAFLDGDYRITIRAFTSNDNIYVHSADSETIEMTILTSPQNVETRSGNISWVGHERAEKNVVRIYKLTDETGAKISAELVHTATIPGNQKSIDISGIQLGKAIYGVTVQALSTTNEHILSSKASEMLQIVRLPQEATYTINDGKLYVKLHKFYTTCHVILTDGDKSCTLTATNDLDTFDPYHFNEFVKADGFEWLNSQVLNTFDNPNYYMMVEMELDNEFTTRSNGYNVEIRLVGNTREDAIVTTLTTATNANKDENGVSAGLINRMPTPIVTLDENTRGVVNLKLDRTKKNMKYFASVDDEGKITECLQGVHLYKTTIFADKKYVIYMADIVYPELFYQTYPQFNSNMFEYKGIIYNVINNVEKDNSEYIQINLNTAKYDMYHYYQDENGELVKGEDDKLVVGTSIDLAQGGSFIVQSQMLGDDSRFVNSNISQGCEVIRYKAITPTLKDGQIKWEKQDVAFGDGTVSESVYLIELSNGTKIMLYNPSVIDENDLTQMLEAEGKDYILDSSYQEVVETDASGKEVSYIIYNNLANKLREINGAFNGGEFNVSVWAHYTNLTGTNIILAQTAPIQSVSIIPQANISLVDGMLTWNMPSVSSTGATGKKIFENYQLQVFVGSELKTIINLTSRDYENNDSVASIDLQRIYGDFTFVTGTNYTFKLVTIGDNVSYINSATTVIENKKILADIGNDLTINNGIVIWNGTGSDEVKIVFAIPTEDGGSTVYSFKDLSTNGQYKLPEWVLINGTYHDLKEGYSYSFQVRAKGDNNNISGFFSEKTVYIQRLSTVTGIKVENGKLIWNESRFFTNIEAGESSSEGVTYTVSYMVDGSTQINTITGLTTNSVDIDDIDAETITVYINAYHNSYVESLASAQVTITRMEKPDASSIEFVENATVMQWQPTKTNGDINRYYKIKVTDGVSTRVYDYELAEGATVANWTIEVDEIFKGKQVNFAIKALSVGEGYLLNSLYCTPVTKTISASITSLSYDSSKQAIFWAPITSGKTDTYYIGYKFNNTTNVYEDITSKIVEEDGMYYYYLEEIGTYGGINDNEPYNGIYIRVVSSNSAYDYDLASRATRYAGTISFTVFDSGSGVEGDAYIIKNENQLENVMYRPNAYFELGGDVNLSSSFDAIENFSGVLDGKSRYIYGTTISGAKESIGIFKQTNNAILKNINISGFNVDIMPSSANFKGALFVTDALNTTFQNVSVVNSTIKFTKNVTSTAEYTGNTSSSGNIYIGVIAGYAKDSSFTDCTVIMLENSDNSNIIINAIGNPEIKIYVGSVVGYISGGSITSNVSNVASDYTFVMQTSITPSAGSYNAPTFKVGSVAGYNKDAEISGTYYNYSKDGTDCSNLYGNI